MSNSMSMYKVYMHKNKTNEKVYIGITMQKPEDRWKNGCGYKNNSHFWNAIQKYGWDGFEHIILEDGLLKENALEKEIYYIDFYKANNPKYGYNKSIGGEGACGVKHTEEWKEENSKRMKGNKHLLGHKHTEETKNKIREGVIKNRKPLSDDERIKLSNRMKGNTYGSHTKTKEECEKLSKALKGHKPTCYIVVRCVNTGEVFNTAKEGAEKYNIKDASCIGRCCRGERKSAGKDKDGNKLVWEFV